MEENKTILSEENVDTKIAELFLNDELTAENLSELKGVELEPFTEKEYITKKVYVIHNGVEIKHTNINKE